MKLNEKLYELRRKSHYSQEQLADQLGVSRQAISKWEKGDNKPDLDNLKKLAEIFEVKIEYLINDDYAEEENKQNKPKSDKTIIKLLSVCAIVSLIVGFVFGKISSKNDFVKEMFKSDSMIANMTVSQDYPSTINVVIFSVVPTYYQNGLKGEFTLVNKTKGETKIIPAEYTEQGFVARESLLKGYDYDVYFTFSQGSASKKLLIFENLKSHGNGISYIRNEDI